MNEREIECVFLPPHSMSPSLHVTINLHFPELAHEAQQNEAKEQDFYLVVIT
jgi:hypothetical protein